MKSDQPIPHTAKKKAGVVNFRFHTTAMGVVGYESEKLEKRYNASY